MTIPAILDIRRLRERFRGSAPGAWGQGLPEGDATDPLSSAAPSHLRDLFDDPLVATWDSLPPPLRSVSDMQRDPVRATARATAHSGWRP